MIVAQALRRVGGAALRGGALQHARARAWAPSHAFPSSPLARGGAAQFQLRAAWASGGAAHKQEVVKPAKATTVSRTLDVPMPLGDDEYVKEEWTARSRRYFDFGKTLAKLYVSGTRDLAMNVLAMNKTRQLVLAGHVPTRTEHRNIHVTRADLYKLIPYAILVALPMTPFLLAFVMVSFPALLPSTYEDRHAKYFAHRMRLRLRKADDVVDLVKQLAAGAHAGEEGEQLAEVLEGLLEDGMLQCELTYSQLAPHSELFASGDISVDRMPHDGVKTMSQFLSLWPWGPKRMLLRQLKRQIKYIEEDNHLLLAEGLDGLSKQALYDAAFERGLCVRGDAEDGSEHARVEEKQVRADLELWLERSRTTDTLLLLTQQALHRTMEKDLLAHYDAEAERERQGLVKKRKEKKEKRKARKQN